MENVTIKLKYLDWKIKNQDKIILDSSNLWPYLNNVKNINFLNHNYFLLRKISDNAFNQMLKYSFNNSQVIKYFCEYCSALYGTTLSENHQFVRVRFPEEETLFIEFAFKIKEHMKQLSSIYTLVLINERFCIKTMQSFIQFYPVYNLDYDKIEIFPALYILLGTNIANNFIKFLKLKPQIKVSNFFKATFNYYDCNFKYLLSND